MFRWIAGIALAGLASTGTSLVASSTSPVADALRNQLPRATKNFVATAEEMPADKYNYKPTPQHMSFGDHIVHMAQFNETMCALIGGGAAPQHAALQATDPKATIVAGLKDSFAYCSTALASLNDASLGANVNFYGSQISKAAAVLILSGDWSDHYAVTATYLRLNGLLPPTAKK